MTLTPAEQAGTTTAIDDCIRGIAAGCHLLTSAPGFASIDIEIAGERIAAAIDSGLEGNDYQDDIVNLIAAHLERARRNRIIGDG